MSMQAQAMSSTVTRELLVAVMGILFFVFLLLFFFYLHARRYRGARRSRIRFILDSDDGATVSRLGLDPAVIKALPITVFRSDEFKEGLECSVCLSELSEGEEARLLPRCNHGFHLECIDMWLHSHSTCPICRSPVCSEPMQSARSGIESMEIPLVGEVSGDVHSMDSQNFPANVLILSSQDRGSSGGPAASTSQGSSSLAGSSSWKSERMLVIDIPNRAVNGFQSSISPLPSSRHVTEDMKSPVSARLRSVRKLLSRGSRGIGSFCSPRGGDIEQGEVGVGGAVEASLLLPKTPTTT